VRFILIRFYSNFKFFEISKSPQIWNFTKIRPVGAELFHGDGRMDRRDKANIFRNFANSPKKCHSEHLTQISPLWDLGETEE
jgi:hypothetical protein